MKKYPAPNDNISRLLERNWQPSIVTSTHSLFYKNGWRCAVNRKDGTMKFSKAGLYDRNLMRGPIEKGIK